MDFINLLRPVSYKWKPQADKLDKNGNLLEKGEGAHAHKRTMFGLLGQQVKEAMTTLGLGYNDFQDFLTKNTKTETTPIGKSHIRWKTKRFS